MKALLLEFVFGNITIFSYLACGIDFSIYSFVAILCAVLDMLFRMFDAKTGMRYVKNSRRATYLWMLPHIIACIMVAIKDDYLSLIVAFGVGAFLFTILYGIIKQGEIKPFAIVEKGIVKRRDIYAICAHTFFLCFIDLLVRYSIINLIFTGFIVVGIIVYTEVAIKIINKGSESKEDEE